MTTTASDKLNQKKSVIETLIEFVKRIVDIRSGIAPIARVEAMVAICIVWAGVPREVSRSGNEEESGCVVSRLSEYTGSLQRRFACVFKKF